MKKHLTRLIMINTLIALQNNIKRRHSHRYTIQHKNLRMISKIRLKRSILSSKLTSSSNLIWIHLPSYLANTSQTTYSPSIPTSQVINLTNNICYVIFTMLLSVVIHTLGKPQISTWTTRKYSNNYPAKKLMNFLIIIQFANELVNY